MPAEQLLCLDNTCHGVAFVMTSFSTSIVQLLFSGLQILRSYRSLTHMWNILYGARRLQPVTIDHSSSDLALNIILERDIHNLFLYDEVLRQ